MNEKQQQLTFNKGITNIPSDAICSDNELEESVGLYFDGEHKPIQKPKEYVELPSGHSLLYVHVYGGFTRYITSKDDKLYWIYENTTNEIGTFAGSASVESIGNTLILSDENGMKYLLWDTRQSQPIYKTLGTNLPDIRMEFSMMEASNNDVTYNDVYHSLEGLLFPVIFDNLDFRGNTFMVGKEDDVKSALIGLVSKRIDQNHEAKRFMFPFWVRYAIRMYDDTYTYISNPILMFPTVRNNWDVFTCDSNGNIQTCDNFNHNNTSRVNYTPLSAKLFYRFTRIPNIQDWSDIIAGVDIFVSEEVKNLDMEGTWTIQNAFIQDGGNVIINPVFTNNTPVTDSCRPEYDYMKRIAAPVSWEDDTNWNIYYQPSLLSDNEIMKKLLEASVFYKLVEIDADEINTNAVDTTTVIQRGVLENITSQTQLNDDYFSRAPMKANVLKAYNSRLHLADVRRGFFNGFSHFSYTSYNGTSKDYWIYVYINTDSGVRIVRTSRRSEEIADIWFFYPDPRAFKAMIFNESDDTLLATLSLKEHPYLNGAYAFVRLPDTNETRSTTIAPEEPTPITDEEIITDRIFVSEVDNPFAFSSKGDVTIRMGGIIGMASQTMALGEMEHGIHPLTVFSEKGISLLRLASDGTYTRSDEVSREVCNNQRSITETDGPVFFSSEKGLMVILGADVKCVSEQLCGKSAEPFQKYLREAFIAYDYRDSLLWIFDGAEHDGVVGSNTCYIYSIRTGTFSKCRLDGIVTNAINNYPDHLLQSGKDVFSLLYRENINDDNSSYSATMTTRPMKLENSLALKSIMQIRHIKDMDGNLTMRILASNNLRNWVELHSMRGTPWKYYKFRFDFSSLKATDTFAGSVVVTQERRIEKLR